MPEPEPLDQFLARSASAQLEPYLKHFRLTPAGQALDQAAMAAEFEKMKKHHAELYRGVKPVKSFFDSSGNVVDCIPFDQQPSVRAARAAGIAVHHAMPAPPHLGHGHTKEAAEAQCQTPSAIEHGPAICPPGSVLMKRVLLEDLAAAGTLENYFKKDPVGDCEKAPVGKPSH